MREESVRPSRRGQPEASRSTTVWLHRAEILPVTGEPWRPDVLGRESTRGLRYLVVDEIFATLAELAMSPWPVIDVRGRLRFPQGETIHLEADAERMRRFLQRHRQPRRGAGRELRTGDTFAVRARARPLAEFLKAKEVVPLTRMADVRELDPATWNWLSPPIYDLTAQARVAAKLAYYGALSESLPKDSERR